MLCDYTYTLAPTNSPTNTLVKPNSQDTLLFFFLLFQTHPKQFFSINETLGVRNAFLSYYSSK